MLAQILEAAMHALVTLNAEGLEDIERQALNLKALLPNGTATTVMPEVMARFRVFADVLKATRENLSVLVRVSSEERRGRMDDAVSLWAR